MKTALIAAALLAAASPQARAQPAAQPQPAGGWVEWVAPPAGANRPQTPAEAERGKAVGRALPRTEVLQPTLDPALPTYRPPAGVRLAGHYKAAASDVLPGLAKAWAAAFRRYHPGVVIDVDSPYAGSLGAKELVKGNIDFVFVSRELKPDDITDFRARFGYDPLSVPVSGGSYRHYGFLDAVGVIVSKDNPIEKISFEQLDRLYSRTHHRGGGAITTWGQLGVSGEWADKPVHLYGIKPWNGFEEFVRQRALSTPGHRGEWRDGIAFSDTVFPLAGKIAGDRYGIAYDGVAYLDAGVKVVAVGADAEGPFFPPTHEYVATAQYPLSRLIFLNTNKAPGKPLPPAVEEFLRFVLSREGQDIVRAQNIYLPLRGWQVEASRALLRP